MADFTVYYYADKDGNTQTTYITAESARDAVDDLGIPYEDVIEVAKVIKDWKKSVRIRPYVLVNQYGYVTAYRASSEQNAIDKAVATFGKEYVWTVRK